MGKASHATVIGLLQDQGREPVVFIVSLSVSVFPMPRSKVSHGGETHILRSELNASDDLSSGHKIGSQKYHQIIRLIVIVISNNIYFGDGLVERERGKVMR